MNPQEAAPKPSATPRPVARADVHTFGVTAADPYGLADADLALVALPRGTTSSTDCADNGLGEYAPASQTSFGKKQSLNATYKAQITGAISGKTLTAGGATAIAVERITINTTKGARATVQIAGHKHIAAPVRRTMRLANGDAPDFNGFGTSCSALPSAPGG
jgi:hypothetical protein